MLMQQPGCLLIYLSILSALTLLGGRMPAPSALCGWQQVFSDDFNGSQLDTTKWNPKYPSGNEGELQYFAPDAFALKDGVLRIKAEKRSLAGHNYTSGIITSMNSFSQQYGYFKLRAKLPKGKGLWSGFWLLPEKPHYPWEIDVFELLGDNPNTIYMTNHWSDPTEGHVKHTEPYTGADFSADFHTFAFQWEPTKMIWYVDDREVYRTNQGIPAEPLFILVDLAVGSDWPGNPDASTPFPSYLDIDYIKVYKQACALY